LSVYRRGKTWWYSFIFCGQHIQESAKTKSKTVAKEAEKTRRRELEDGYDNIIPEDRNRRWRRQLKNVKSNTRRETPRMHRVTPNTASSTWWSTWETRCSLRSPSMP
jgi:hypothetical protein